MKVGLVSCCGPKLDRPAPAQDLYTSDLFKKSRAYVEATCDRWAILSAKHGLVMPNQVLEPYDVRLGAMPATERRVWALTTHTQLRAAFGPDAKFVVLAGKRYLAATEGLKVVTPLAGKGIGERLSWLKSKVR